LGRMDRKAAWSWCGVQGRVQTVFIKGRSPDWDRPSTGDGLVKESRPPQHRAAGEVAHSYQGTSGYWGGIKEILGLDRICHLDLGGCLAGVIPKPE
jgi:hypothetical protein